MKGFNTLFSYLYRDGNNFKKGGETVFSGTVSKERLDELYAAFDDDGFIPGQVRIVPVFLFKPFGEYEHRTIDHNWHACDGVANTDAKPNDPHGRTMEQFVDEVVAASESGWREDVLPSAWAGDGTPVLNDNCLDGVSCPACQSQGPFLTRVCMTMEVADDGTEYPSDSSVDTGAEWGGVYLSAEEVADLRGFLSEPDMAPTADDVAYGDMADSMAENLNAYRSFANKVRKLLSGRDWCVCGVCGHRGPWAGFISGK